MCHNASAAYPQPTMGNEVKLDPEPESVGKARAFAEANLRGLGFPDSVDDGVLIVSELATNALRHASGAPFLVVVRVDDGHNPVIEVHDGSPEPPELLPPDFVSEGGRGLHVVDALCKSLTYTQSDNGKAVIATLR